jgi:lipoyl(octanoyl) transferase
MGEIVQQRDASRTLHVRFCGRLPYARGLELQDSLVVARRRGEIDDTLLMLEHPPVVTLGRSSHDEHLLADRDELERKGVELFACGRGGDVTFHGPGQLVGYPILALEGGERDAHRYLRNLEEALILAVSRFGVSASRIEGLTGIWVGNEKLAAIGVRLNSGWITSHGFALNVSTDLDGFSDIVPCGIGDRGVTSLQRLLGAAAPSMDRAAAEVADALASVLGRVETSGGGPGGWS